MPDGQISPTWGWACAFPETDFIHEGTVRRVRAEAIERIGHAWARDDETPQQGWRRAYRKGWRCIRVTITPFGQN